MVVGGVVWFVVALKVHEWLLNAVAELEKAAITNCVTFFGFQEQFFLKIHAVLSHYVFVAFQLIFALEVD